MLTKAILTGGVLSVLAGSIVYFGTEGADALEREVREDVRLEETELAGGPEAVTEVTDAAKAVVKTPKQRAKKKKAEAQAIAKEKYDSEVVAHAETQLEEVVEKSISQTDARAEGYVDGALVTSDAQAEPKTELRIETQAVEAPQAKSKTRWLDQYLKSTKDKAPETDIAAPKSEVIDVVVAKTDETEIEETSETATKDVMTEVEVEIEVESGKKMMADIEDGAHSEGTKTTSKNLIVKMDGDKKMVWSSHEEDLGEALLDEDVDMEMVEKLLSEHTDLDLNDVMGAKTEIRVIKKGGKKRKGAGHHNKMSLKAIDYEAVLVEAKKLQVIDMRNEAFLEIVDYAIDRGDIGNAADIVEELSSPELRDTARARIGVGLATSGDMEAAFAVLDEVEIDELAAPIRLEIIAALMATRAERAARRNVARGLK